MTRPRPATLARVILTDATVLATLIDAALTNLDLGLAGWPETTPGASPAQQGTTAECHHRDCSESSPCPIHNPDATQALTPTERLAITPDLASRDLGALEAAVAKAAHHIATAATIAAHWQIGIADDTVTARLVSIDAEIWCANCVRYGRHEPKARERTECEFCSGFRQQRKRAAPKEIWDARDARNGRLDETTITRILKRLDADRKANATAARNRQRAERKVSF